MLEEAKDLEPKQPFSKKEAIELIEVLNEIFDADVLNENYTTAIEHATQFIEQNLPKE